MIDRREFLRKAFRIGGVAALASLGMSPRAIASFVRGSGASGSAPVTIGPMQAHADSEYSAENSLWTRYENGYYSDNVMAMGDYDQNWLYYAFYFYFGYTIPAGAVIDQAETKLELYGLGRSAQWDNNVDDLVVFATDAANAAIPTDASDRPSESGGGTTVTTAYALVENLAWPTSGSPGWVEFIGSGGNTVGAILQELVDSYGGIAENSEIVFWIRGASNSNLNDAGKYVVAAGVLYDYGNLNPRMTIKYTV